MCGQKVSLRTVGCVVAALLVVLIAVGVQLLSNRVDKVLNACGVGAYVDNKCVCVEPYSGDHCEVVNCGYGRLVSSVWEVDRITTPSSPDAIYGCECENKFWGVNCVECTAVSPLDCTGVCKANYFGLHCDVLCKEAESDEDGEIVDHIALGGIARWHRPDRGVCLDGEVVCKRNEDNLYYTGDHCEFTCPDCRNGGVCDYDENGAFCRCVNNFVGDVCQFSCPLFCSGAGVCRMVDGTPTCDCEQDRTGIGCELPCCVRGARTPFNRVYGGCEPGVGGCVCDDGWKGTSCDCHPDLTCGSRGVCGDGECICGERFAGKYCEMCSDAYAGPDCDIVKPDCNAGRFVQINNHGDYGCVCDFGFVGEFCDACVSNAYPKTNYSNPCRSIVPDSVCNSGRVRDDFDPIDRPNMYMCECDAGFSVESDCTSCVADFYGERCDVKCDEACTNEDSGGMCSHVVPGCLCPESKQLNPLTQSCEVCVAGGCENGGTCVKGRCRCDPGFYGDRCHVTAPEFEGKVCNGHGSVLLFTDDATCDADGDCTDTEHAEDANRLVAILAQRYDRDMFCYHADTPPELRGVDACCVDENGVCLARHLDASFSECASLGGDYVLDICDKRVLEGEVSVYDWCLSRANNCTRNGRCDDPEFCVDYEPSDVDWKRRWEVDHASSMSSLMSEPWRFPSAVPLTTDTVRDPYEFRMWYEGVSLDDVCVSDLYTECRDALIPDVDIYTFNPSQKRLFRDGWRAMPDYASCSAPKVYSFAVDGEETRSIPEAYWDRMLVTGENVRVLAWHSSSSVRYASRVEASVDRLTVIGSGDVTLMLYNYTTSECERLQRRAGNLYTQCEGITIVELDYDWGPLCAWRKSLVNETGGFDNMLYEQSRACAGCENYQEGCVDLPLGVETPLPDPCADADWDAFCVDYLAGNTVRGSCAYLECDCESDNLGVGGKACESQCPVPTGRENPSPCGEDEDPPWGRCVAGTGKQLGLIQGTCKCVKPFANPEEGCSVTCNASEFHCSSDVDTPVSVERYECNYEELVSVTVPDGALALTSEGERSFTGMFANGTLWDSVSGTAFEGLSQTLVTCNIMLPDSSCNVYKGICECAQPYMTVSDGIEYLNPAGSYRVALMQGYDMVEYTPFLTFTPPLTVNVRSLGFEYCPRNYYWFESAMCGECEGNEVCYNTDALDLMGNTCDDYSPEDCGQFDVEAAYVTISSGTCATRGYVPLTPSFCEAALNLFSVPFTSMVPLSSTTMSGCVIGETQGAMYDMDVPHTYSFSVQSQCPLSADPPESELVVIYEQNCEFYGYLPLTEAQCVPFSVDARFTQKRAEYPGASYGCTHEGWVSPPSVQVDHCVGCLCWNHGLDPLPKTCVVSVMSGTCESAGYRTIDSESACRALSAQWGGADMSKPAGCVLDGGVHYHRPETDPTEAKVTCEGVQCQCSSCEVAPELDEEICAYRVGHTSGEITHYFEGECGVQMTPLQCSQAAFELADVYGEDHYCYERVRRGTCVSEESSATTLMECVQVCGDSGFARFTDTCECLSSCEAGSVETLMLFPCASPVASVSGRCASQQSVTACADCAVGTLEEKIVECTSRCADYDDVFVLGASCVCLSGSCDAPSVDMEGHRVPVARCAVRESQLIYNPTALGVGLCGRASEGGVCSAKPEWDYTVGATVGATAGASVVVTELAECERAAAQMGFRMHVSGSVCVLDGYMRFGNGESDVNNECADRAFCDIVTGDWVYYGNRFTQHPYRFGDRLLFTHASNVAAIIATDLQGNVLNNYYLDITDFSQLEESMFSSGYRNLCSSGGYCLENFNINRVVKHRFTRRRYVWGDPGVGDCGTRANRAECLVATRRAGELLQEVHDASLPSGCVNDRWNTAQTSVGCLGFTCVCVERVRATLDVASEDIVRSSLVDMTSQVVSYAARAEQLPLSLYWYANKLDKRCAMVTDLPFHNRPNPYTPSVSTLQECLQACLDMPRCDSFSWGNDCRLSDYDCIWRGYLGTGKCVGPEVISEHTVSDLAACKALCVGECNYYAYNDGECVLAKQCTYGALPGVPASFEETSAWERYAVNYESSIGDDIYFVEPHRYSVPAAVPFVPLPLDFEYEWEQISTKCPKYTLRHVGDNLGVLSCFSACSGEATGFITDSNAGCFCTFAERTDTCTEESIEYIGSGRCPTYTLRSDGLYTSGYIDTNSRSTAIEACANTCPGDFSLRLTSTYWCQCSSDCTSDNVVDDFTNLGAQKCEGSVDAAGVQRSASLRANSDAYKRRTSGFCTSEPGWGYITSKDRCLLATASLGISATEIHDSDYSSAPFGCHEYTTNGVYMKPTRAPVQCSTDLPCICEYKGCDDGVFCDSVYGDWVYGGNRFSQHPFRLGNRLLFMHASNVNAIIATDLQGNVQGNYNLYVTNVIEIEESMFSSSYGTACSAGGYCLENFEGSVPARSDSFSNCADGATCADVRGELLGLDQSPHRLGANLLFSQTFATSDADMECDSDPCVAGSCKRLNGYFKCICPSGYEGVRCERQTSPCSSGVYTTSTYTRQTGLPSGISAEYCMRSDYSNSLRPYAGGDLPSYATTPELRAQACYEACINANNDNVMDPAPYNPNYWNNQEWYNAATFLVKETDGRCYCYGDAPSGGSCPAGTYYTESSSSTYVGYNIEHTCETPCSPNPCYTGTCSVQGNGFACACPSGYEGERCERQTSPCADKYVSSTATRQTGLPSGISGEYCMRSDYSNSVRPYAGGDLPSYATTPELRTKACYEACINANNDNVIDSAPYNPNYWNNHEWYSAAMFLVLESSGRCFCYTVAPSGGSCSEGSYYTDSNYIGYTIEHFCTSEGVHATLTDLEGNSVESRQLFGTYGTLTRAQFDTGSIVSFSVSNFRIVQTADDRLTTMLAADAAENNYAIAQYTITPQDCHSQCGTRFRIVPTDSISFCVCEQDECVLTSGVGTMYRYWVGKTDSAYRYTRVQESPCPVIETTGKTSEECAAFCGDRNSEVSCGVDDPDCSRTHYLRSNTRADTESNIYRYEPCDSTANTGKQDCPTGTDEQRRADCAARCVTDASAVAFWIWNKAFIESEFGTYYDYLPGCWCETSGADTNVDWVTYHANERTNRYVFTAVDMSQATCTCTASACVFFNIKTKKTRTDNLVNTGKFTTASEVMCVNECYTLLHTDAFCDSSESTTHSVTTPDGCYAACLQSGAGAYDAESFVLGSNCRCLAFDPNRCGEVWVNDGTYKKLELTSSSGTNQYSMQRDCYCGTEALLLTYQECQVASGFNLQLGDRRGCYIENGVWNWGDDGEIACTSDSRCMLKETAVPGVMYDREEGCVTGGDHACKDGEICTAIHGDFVYTSYENRRHHPYRLGDKLLFYRPSGSDGLRVVPTDLSGNQLGSIWFSGVTDITSIDQALYDSKTLGGKCEDDAYCVENIEGGFDVESCLAICLEKQEPVFTVTQFTCACGTPTSGSCTTYRYRRSEVLNVPAISYTKRTRPYYEHTTQVLFGTQGFSMPANPRVLPREMFPTYDVCKTVETSPYVSMPVCTDGYVTARDCSLARELHPEKVFSDDCTSSAHESQDVVLNVQSGNGVVYVINGSPNPTITACSGDNLVVNKLFEGHPFKVVRGDVSWQDALNLPSHEGVMDQGTYTYICTLHSPMIGRIQVSDCAETHTACDCTYDAHESQDVVLNVQSGNGIVYVINGSPNPTITACSGDNLVVNKLFEGHPFKVVRGDVSWQDALNLPSHEGVMEQGTYTYICTLHSPMIGRIEVSDCAETRTMCEKLNECTSENKCVCRMPLSDCTGSALPLTDAQCAESNCNGKCLQQVKTFDAVNECCVCGGGTKGGIAQSFFKRGNECACSEDSSDVECPASMDTERFELVDRNAPYSFAGGGMCEDAIPVQLDLTDFEDHMAFCAGACSAMDVEAFALNRSQCFCTNNCDSDENVDRYAFRDPYVDRYAIQELELAAAWEDRSRFLRCYKDLEHRLEVPCSHIRALKHFARGTSYRVGDCSNEAPGTVDQVPCSGKGFVVSSKCVCDYAEDLDLGESGVGLLYEEPTSLQTPYRGVACDQFCPGYDMRTMDSVCSGHGVCRDTNGCDCDQSFTGYKCHLRCEANPGPLSCSGHGTCEEREIEYERDDIYEVRDAIESWVCPYELGYLARDKLVRINDTVHYVFESEGAEIYQRLNVTLGYYFRVEELDKRCEAPMVEYQLPVDGALDACMTLCAQYEGFNIIPTAGTCQCLLVDAAECNTATNDDGEIIGTLVSEENWILYDRVFGDVLIPVEERPTVSNDYYVYGALYRKPYKSAEPHMPCFDTVMSTRERHTMPLIELEHRPVVLPCAVLPNYRVICGMCRCFEHDAMGHYTGHNCRTPAEGYFGARGTKTCRGMGEDGPCNGRGTCNWGSLLGLGTITETQTQCFCGKVDDDVTFDNAPRNNDGDAMVHVTSASEPLYVKTLKYVAHECGTDGFVHVDPANCREAAAFLGKTFEDDTITASFDGCAEVGTRVFPASSEESTSMELDGLCTSQLPLVVKAYTFSDDCEVRVEDPQECMIAVSEFFPEFVLEAVTATLVTRCDLTLETCEQAAVFLGKPGVTRDDSKPKGCTFGTQAYFSESPNTASGLQRVCRSPYEFKLERISRDDLAPGCIMYDSTFALNTGSGTDCAEGCFCKNDVLDKRQIIEVTDFSMEDTCKEQCKYESDRIVVDIRIENAIAESQVVTHACIDRDAFGRVGGENGKTIQPHVPYDAVSMVDCVQQCARNGVSKEGDYTKAAVAVFTHEFLPEGMYDDPTANFGLGGRKYYEQRDVFKCWCQNLTTQQECADAEDVWTALDGQSSDKVDSTMLPTGRGRTWNIAEAVFTAYMTVMPNSLEGTECICYDKDPCGVSEFIAVFRSSGYCRDFLSKEECFAIADAIDYVTVHNSAPLQNDPTLAHGCHLTYTVFGNYVVFYNTHESNIQCAERRDWLSIDMCLCAAEPVDLFDMHTTPSRIELIQRDAECEGRMVKMFEYGENNMNPGLKIGREADVCAEACVDKDPPASTSLYPFGEDPAIGIMIKRTVGSPEDGECYCIFEDTACAHSENSLYDMYEFVGTQSVCVSEDQRDPVDGNFNRRDCSCMRGFTGDLCRDPRKTCILGGIESEDGEYCTCLNGLSEEDARLGEGCCPKGTVYASDRYMSFTPFENRAPIRDESFFKDSLLEICRPHPGITQNVSLPDADKSRSVFNYATNADEIRVIGRATDCNDDTPRVDYLYDYEHITDMPCLHETYETAHKYVFASEFKDKSPAVTREDAVRYCFEACVEKEYEIGENENDEEDMIHGFMVRGDRVPEVYKNVKEQFESVLSGDPLYTTYYEEYSSMNCSCVRKEIRASNECGEAGKTEEQDAQLFRIISAPLGCLEVTSQDTRRVFNIGREHLHTYDSDRRVGVKGSVYAGRSAGTQPVQAVERNMGVLYLSGCEEQALGSIGYIECALRGCHDLLHQNGMFFKQAWVWNRIQKEGVWLYETNFERSPWDGSQGIDVGTRNRYGCSFYDDDGFFDNPYTAKRIHEDWNTDYPNSMCPDRVVEIYSPVEFVFVSSHTCEHHGYKTIIDEPTCERAYLTTMQDGISSVYNTDDTNNVPAFCSQQIFVMNMFSTSVTIKTTYFNTADDALDQCTGTYNCVCQRAIPGFPLASKGALSCLTGCSEGVRDTEDQRRFFDYRTAKYFAYTENTGRCRCYDFVPNDDARGECTDNTDPEWTYVFAHQGECMQNGAEWEMEKPAQTIDDCAHACRGQQLANRPALGFIWSGSTCYCEANPSHPHPDCGGEPSGGYVRYDFNNVQYYEIAHFNMNEPNKEYTVYDMEPLYKPILEHEDKNITDSTYYEITFDSEVDASRCGIFCAQREVREENYFLRTAGSCLTGAFRIDTEEECRQAFESTGAIVESISSDSPIPGCSSKSGSAYFNYTAVALVENADCGTDGYNCLCRRTDAPVYFLLPERGHDPAVKTEFIGHRECPADTLVTAQDLNIVQGSVTYSMCEKECVRRQCTYFSVSLSGCALSFTECNTQDEASERLVATETWDVQPTSDTNIGYVLSHPGECENNVDGWEINKPAGRHTATECADACRVTTLPKGPARGFVWSPGSCWCEANPPHPHVDCNEGCKSGEICKLYKGDFVYNTHVHRQHYPLMLGEKLIFYQEDSGGARVVATRLNGVWLSSFWLNYGVHGISAITDITDDIYDSVDKGPSCAMGGYCLENFASSRLAFPDSYTRYEFVYMDTQYSWKPYEFAHFGECEHNADGWEDSETSGDASVDDCARACSGKIYKNGPVLGFAWQRGSCYCEANPSHPHKDCNNFDCEDNTICEDVTGDFVIHQSVVVSNQHPYRVGDKLLFYKSESWGLRIVVTTLSGAYVWGFWVEGVSNIAHFSASNLQTYLDDDSVKSLCSANGHCVDNFIGGMKGFPDAYARYNYILDTSRVRFKRVELTNTLDPWRNTDISLLVDSASCANVDGSELNIMSSTKSYDCDRVGTSFDIRSNAGMYPRIATIKIYVQPTWTAYKNTRAINKVGDADGALSFMEMRGNTCRCHIGGTIHPNQGSRLFRVSGGDTQPTWENSLFYRRNEKNPFVCNMESYTDNSNIDDATCGCEDKFVLREMKLFSTTAAFRTLTYLKTPGDTKEQRLQACAYSCINGVNIASEEHNHNPDFILDNPPDAIRLSKSGECLCHNIAAGGFDNPYNTYEFAHKGECKQNAEGWEINKPWGTVSVEACARACRGVTLAKGPVLGFAFYVGSCWCEANPSHPHEDCPIDAKDSYTRYDFRDVEVADAYQIVSGCNCEGEYMDRGMRKSCARGSFNMDACTTKCTLCPKGYYQDNEKASECKICPKGYFQDGVGQARCRVCTNTCRSDPSMLTRAESNVISAKKTRDTYSVIFRELAEYIESEMNKLISNYNSALAIVNTYRDAFEADPFAANALEIYMGAVRALDDLASRMGVVVESTYTEINSQEGTNIDWVSLPIATTLGSASIPVYEANALYGYLIAQQNTLVSIAEDELTEMQKLVANEGFAGIFRECEQGSVKDLSACTPCNELNQIVLFDASQASKAYKPQLGDTYITTSVTLAEGVYAPRSVTYSRPTECGSCKPGEYLDGDCKTCPAGWRGFDPATRTCVICPEGYYQDSAGTTHCKKCASGHHQIHRGGTEPCIACPIGWAREAYFPNSDEIMLAQPETKTCLPCGSIYGKTIDWSQFSSRTEVVSYIVPPNPACIFCHQYQDEAGQQTCKKCDGELSGQFTPHSYLDVTENADSSGACKRVENIYYIWERRDDYKATELLPICAGFIGNDYPYYTELEKTINSVWSGCVYTDAYNTYTRYNQDDFDIDRYKYWGRNRLPGFLQDGFSKDYSIQTYGKGRDCEEELDYYVHTYKKQTCNTGTLRLQYDVYRL